MNTFPKPYQHFIDNYPELKKAYETLGEKCHDWGPLDPKTRRLIKLGIALGLNSKGAVKSHAKLALEAGASKDEIRHAVVLGITTVGFPLTMCAMSWVEEILEEE